MIIAAFAVAGAGALASLALFAAAKRAAVEKQRVALEAELSTVFTKVQAESDSFAKGLYQGLPVTLTLGHNESSFTVTLPPAVLRYNELMDLFGSAELKRELKTLEMRLSPEASDTNLKTPDQLVGVFTREPGVGENVGTLATRLAFVIKPVLALREKAPAELLARLAKVRASSEIDQILLGLSEHFTHAPETEAAIELAAEREHEHPDRVRERAERWRLRGQAQ